MIEVQLEEVDGLTIDHHWVSHWFVDSYFKGIFSYIIGKSSNWAATK